MNVIESVSINNDLHVDGQLTVGAVDSIKIDETSIELGTTIITKDAISAGSISSPNITSNNVTVSNTLKVGNRSGNGIDQLYVDSDGIIHLEA